MDENVEHKIRDLRLKILRVEKELARTIHNVNLGAWLRAGHPSQMAKAGERERKRLETKLSELRAQLETLAPGSTPQPAPPPVEAAPPAPPPAPVKPKPKAKTEAKRTPSPPVSKAKTTKKAAAKKPAAPKSAKAKKK